MDRVVYMELAGVKYPLLFSMKAFIDIINKFNSLAEAIKAMETDYDSQFEMACILSSAAAEYLKREKKKAPTLTKEMLEFGSPYEIANGLLKSIMECIGKGGERTVEAEESSKNAETAQE